MATPFHLEPATLSRKLQHGDKFGNWQLDAEALSLVILNEHGNFRYDIDLERISSSAEMLDYIFQVYRKGWGKAETLGLIEALQQIFQPQGSLCSMGADRKIEDVTSFLLKRIERPEHYNSADDEE